MKLREKETRTEFEYRAGNDVRKNCSATQEIEFVEYFKQADKLHYGQKKKEALKLTLLFGKESGVIMPDSWITNECAGNKWLRGLRKSHLSLCMRNPEASSFTRSSGFNREIAREFCEN